MGPRVTVLMPVYNGQRYLRQAIDSILRQTFEDFEFLIVDDGSTDASPSIIDAYSDPRIRVIRNQRNLGQTESMNVGLQLARGDYVARQDADDISEPERLKLQVNYLDRCPETAVVGTQGTLIGPNNQYLGLYPLPTPTCSLDIHWKLMFLNPLIHTSVMLRRQVVLREMGGYDPTYSYAEDYDLWSRVSFRARLANLPHSLIRYRVHDQSKMNRSLSKTHTDRRHAEPAAVNRRNLCRILPDLSEHEVDVLNVFGRGAKKLSPTFPVERAFRLYFKFTERFVESLPPSVASAENIKGWQEEQSFRSFLALADAYTYQSSRKQALKVVWLVWRFDFDGLAAWSRLLIKITLGPRLGRLVRRSYALLALDAKSLPDSGSIQ